MLVRCRCLFFLGGFSFAQRGHGFCRKIFALAALGTSFCLAGVMILSHVFSCIYGRDWGPCPRFQFWDHLHDTGELLKVPDGARRPASVQHHKVNECIDSASCPRAVEFPIE